MLWINVTRGRTNIYLSDLNKLKVYVHQNVRKATPNHNISRDLWHTYYTERYEDEATADIEMENNTFDMSRCRYQQILNNMNTKIYPILYDR